MIVAQSPSYTQKSADAPLAVLGDNFSADVN